MLARKQNYQCLMKWLACRAKGHIFRAFSQELFRPHELETVSILSILSYISCGHVKCNKKNYMGVLSSIFTSLPYSGGGIRYYDVSLPE